ncbi:MAG: hypothetical protein KDI23_04365 [Pseudomonadales bacterium]|nr:hypothetical protein [Pseudomonadales bacterium]
MRVRAYDRQVAAPSTAGGVLLQGAGTAEQGQARGLATVGEVTAEVARANNELDARLRASERSLKAGRLKLDYELKAGALLEQRSADPTLYGSLSQDMAKARGKLRDQTLQLAGDDELLRRALTHEIDQLDQRAAIETRRIARTQQIDVTKGVMTSTLADYARLYAGSSPADRASIATEVNDIIGAQVHAGIVSAEEGVKLSMGWQSDVEANDIMQQMQDPGQIRQLQAELLDPGIYPALAPDDRTRLQGMVDRLIEQDDRERIRLAEKAERDAERALKDAQDARAAEFRVGIMEGAVGERDLTMALETGQIDLQAFNSLLPALQAEREQRDDPTRVVRLQRDIGDGTASEAQVWSAYADGALSKGTAVALMKQAESVRRGGGVLARDDVQRQRAYVDATVGGMRGPLAVLDSASSQRVANAIREYDERVAAEYDRAKADGRPFDPKAVADAVVDLYRPSPPDRLALPRPLFAGERPSSLEDVQAVRQRTAEAAFSGDITPEQAAEQERLLQQYEEALAP